MTISHRWFVLAAGLVFAAAPAFAEDRKSDAPRGKDGHLSDEDFVAKVASSGLMEIESARSAVGQTNSDRVKKYAKHMIEDHTKANQELMALAARKGLRVPQGMSEKHFDQLKSLSKLTDNEFNTAYAKNQVAAHEEAVKLFENASKSLKDADLKAFAEKTLPTLKHHLEMARDLNKDAKSDGKVGASKDGKRD
jgi:putative membrane protein